MSLQRLNAADAAQQLTRFDAVIDARSPAEFAEDHLPGALNWPVLDDEERARVGTLYKQVSAFDARKLGSALVARNIADHIDTAVRGLPREWKPLVYCWRGGDRSGTLAWFLDRIGFRTTVLDGGYKAFRAVVRTHLCELPKRVDWRVLCGRTGCGKTRLLHALAEAGAQVLDLEALARHRGSVLGLPPGVVQPSQKAFDSACWQALSTFDPARPVWIESESRKIGQLFVPEALLDEARTRGRCVRVELGDEARVALLLEDYAYLDEDRERFCTLLDGLRELRGNEQVKAWQEAVRAGRIGAVFAELMAHHYDPGYLRSLAQQFRGFEAAQRLELVDAGAASLADAAQGLVAAG